MSDKKMISELLFKKLQETISEAEETLLEQWTLSNHENLYLHEELLNEDALNQSISEYHPENRRSVQDSIFSKIEGRIPELRGKTVKMKTAWWKYAAAVILP